MDYSCCRRSTIIHYFRGGKLGHAKHKDRVKDRGRRRDPHLAGPELGCREDQFAMEAMKDVYFCDFGVQVVRPERCLINTCGGSLPSRWLGQKALRPGQKIRIRRRL